VDDPTVPICSCGYKWEYYREWSDGRRYVSAELVAKYHALYGAPSKPFLQVSDGQ
jgi:hypothetical protein